jgi:transcriptional regulator with XRE-family HTH domain
MSEQEKNIVTSIADKLEIILQKNKITILALSKLLAIDKQILYRIMKREHVPNLLFLELISNYLNCTILELLDQRFFLDINVFNEQNTNNQKECVKYRIYIYDENFKNIVDNNFFGIINGGVIKIFYKVTKISHDGFYLINDENNELKELNILSVGTNLIIALINDKEIRLNPEQIIVSAKLYKTVNVIQSKEYALRY